MEIQTLTKRQLKSTLSEKKFKSKDVIKNILSTPYKSTFWPLLSSEDESQFKIILEKNLPCVKPLKVNIPWQEIKSVPKLHRKEFRREYCKRIITRWPDDSKSQGLVLGINDVTRALEQNSLGTVLLSSDVHPKIMVQHVLDMAVLQNIPILIVPNLRQLTKTYCGINSVALGIAKTAPETSPLSVIKVYSQQFFKTIPILKELINSDRSLNLNNKREQIDEENNIMDIENCNQNSSHEDNESHSFYLEKKENNLRTFIPQNSKIETAMDTRNIFEVTYNSQKKLLKKYLPLRVKRVKSDITRHKKKIKILKKSH